MKNLEVVHTLRLYDADFIAKLGALMEKEKNHYRNKNEFLTAVLKMGYDQYVKAASGAKTYSPGAGSGTTATDDAKETNALINQLCELTNLSFKKIMLQLELLQTVHNTTYNILRSFNDDERLMPDKVDDGFYDDLPARFEKIIVRLEAKYGL